MTQYWKGDASSEVYSERAAVAVALARVARSLGYRVGFGFDPTEPQWPVLYVALPTGQVSWHLSKDDRKNLAADIPDDEGMRWDGHTTPDKYRRLDKWSRTLDQARRKSMCLCATVVLSQGVHEETCPFYRAPKRSIRIAIRDLARSYLWW